MTIKRTSHAAAVNNKAIKRPSVNIISIAINFICDLCEHHVINIVMYDTRGSIIMLLYNTIIALI